FLLHRQGLGGLLRRWLRWRRRVHRRKAVRGCDARAAAGIETLLLRPPRLAAVIGGTPLAGTLPPMVLAAAERAAHVQPTSAARMREKADAAVAAESDTVTQVGIRL